MTMKTTHTYQDSRVPIAERVRVLMIRMTLTEGRKREVKQLCKSVGHPVEHLRRVEFAGLVLKDLRAGQWRLLTKKEVERLKQMVGLR